MKLLTKKIVSDIKDTVLCSCLIKTLLLSLLEKTCLQNCCNQPRALVNSNVCQKKDKHKIVLICLFRCRTKGAVEY